METPEQRIARVVREEITISPYDPRWPESFRQEKEHLQSCLPKDLVRRIEHFGSTAVPGLAAKPIVDMLVEVSDLEATRDRIAPVLEFYAWFIKRDPRTGARTHHIHMVEADFAEHWDRLLFRDYLIEQPEVAKEYEVLKCRLASALPQERVAYTRSKTDFVVWVTEQAKRYYGRA